MKNNTSFCLNRGQAKELAELLQEFADRQRDVPGSSIFVTLRLTGLDAAIPGVSAVQLSLIDEGKYVDLLFSAEPGHPSFGDFIERPVKGDEE